MNTIEQIKAKIAASKVNNTLRMIEATEKYKRDPDALKQVLGNESWQAYFRAQPVELQAMFMREMIRHPDTVGIIVHSRFFIEWAIPIGKGFKQS